MDVGEDGHPPFVATINERATKFRAVGACLTWNAKPGSDKLKEALLMLLGDCLATNTFALGCDFTKEEVDELKKGNKGKFPNRRRKEKREAEVVQEAPSSLDVLNSPSHHRATTSNNSSQPYSQGHKRRIGQSSLGLTADSCQPSTSKRPRLEVEAHKANNSRQLDKFNSRKRKAPESPIPMLDFSKRQCQGAEPHRDTGSNAHSSSPLFQTASHGVIRSTTASNKYINRRGHLQGRTNRLPRPELINGRTAPVVGSTKTKTSPTTFNSQDDYNDSQIILQEAHVQYPLEQVATPSQIPTYRVLRSPHQDSLSGQYLDQYNYQPQFPQAQTSNGPRNRHQTGFPLSDHCQYQNTAPACRLGSDSLDSSQRISRASLQQSNQSTLSEFDPFDVYDADKYLPDLYRVSKTDNVPKILQDKESLYGGPATTQPTITTYHQATNPDVHPEHPPSTIMTSSGPRILDNHDACQWTGILPQSEIFVDLSSHAYQSPEIVSTSGPRLEDVDDTFLGSEATPDSEQGVPNHDLAVPSSTTSSGFGPSVWSAGHAHPSPVITPDSESTFLDIDYIDYALLGSAPHFDSNLFTEGDCCALDDDYYLKPRSSNAEPRAADTLANAIQRACMDLCQGTGTPYPYDLVEEHKTESYASQIAHLRRHFERLWTGPQHTPKLYKLSEWIGRFPNGRPPMSREIH